MRRHLILISFVILSVVAKPRFRRQNYDALLRNKAFVDSQVNCVLKKGHCDSIGSRLRELVPSVVNGGSCSRCNESERRNMAKILAHVKNNYPDAYSKIINLYSD